MAVPLVPPSGERFTMACGRAAIANMAEFLPENDPRYAAHYQLEDFHRTLVVWVTRMNEVIGEKKYRWDSPPTITGLKSFVRDVLEFDDKRREAA